MTEEEWEPILRRIRELEDRLRARQDTIDYLETIMSVRREETKMTHEQLMAVDTAYRGSFYSARALRGWQTRDRKELEELRKLVPPIKALRIVLTFSIETGTGHEPFYAEVTCDTVIPADTPREEQDRLVNRIVNATVKLFWILFDIQKSLYDMELKGLKGTEPYNFIVKRKEFFQKYATEIYEAAMDNLIKPLLEMGVIARDKEEYVTRQAILKIGVEYYPAAADAEPSYPFVHVLVEKGKSAETKGEWIVERTIVMADETDVNILEILEMTIE